MNNIGSQEMGLHIFVDYQAHTYANNLLPLKFSTGPLTFSLVEQTHRSQSIECDLSLFRVNLPVRGENSNKCCE